MTTYTDFLGKMAQAEKNFAAGGCTPTAALQAAGLCTTRSGTNESPLTCPLEEAIVASCHRRNTIEVTYKIQMAWEKYQEVQLKKAA